MPLIRGHHEFDENFTQVPNAWLRDTRLSLGARGLLGQLLSHRPGWSVSIDRLASANGCGRDRIRSYIRELLDVGYLSRSETQRRTSEGFLAGYDYVTVDPPWSDYPTKAEPTKAEPSKGNPAHKNTISKNTKLENTKLIEGQFEDFWQLYPTRLGKGEAKRAFAKALERIAFEDLMDGARRFAADPNLPPKQYIPRPATWLNQDRWADDPYPERPEAKRANTAKLIDEWSRTETPDGD